MKRRAFLASTVGLAIVPAALPFGPGPQEVGPHGALTNTGGALSSDARFETWLTGFRARATGRFPQGLVDRELAGLSADPRVLAQDSRQPEFSKPAGAYIQTTAAPSRAALGRQKLAALEPWMDATSDRYGVPPEILTAIWGVETGYGAVMGDFDTVRALATLAAEGHRPDWAEGQLISALKIIASGEAPRASLRGSWAGAMGQTQFTPEDYLVWSVDGDGDGKRDIWGSSKDALASAANFLSHKAMWRRGGSWAREVNLPSGFDYSIATETVQKTPAEWRAMGVVPANGQPYRAADQGVPTSVILPQGYRAPAFLVFPNHIAIRAYNNSISYALGVGLLADGIAGNGGVLKAWPDDAPLSLGDRIAAQQALTRLGFDPGAQDGVLGTNTRKSVRAWQASRGLPADGYLTLALIGQLRQQAGPLA